MRTSRLLLTLSLAAAPLATLPAQGRLDSGSVVRVQPGAGARWRVGRLRAVAGDTLWLASVAATADREGRALVAPRERARVEVSEDYDAISRRRHRTIVGSGIVMALLASAGRDPKSEWDAGPIGTPAFGFASGVVLGVVAAEIFYPRRWYRVER